MKDKHLIIATDFGEVALDMEARDAINMILDFAWSLQMTPGEFMQMFEHGIPACPHCEEGECH